MIALTEDFFMFKTKAEKKRALDVISHKFYKNADKFKLFILESRIANEDDALKELYFNVPIYPHQWTEKKRGMFSEYVTFCISSDILKRRYDKVKNTEIGVSETVSKEVQIKSDIYAIIQKRRESFVRGLDLADKFNGLQVHVNAHMVYCQNREPYVRHFFYLFGKLTALNTIIAVAEEHKNKNK